MSRTVLLCWLSRGRSPPNSWLPSVPSRSPICATTGLPREQSMARGPGSRAPATRAKTVSSFSCARRRRPALGARDTLRLEAGMALYGHEIDRSTTPFEAGLDWIVKLDKGEFIGRPALLSQKSRGLERQLLGFD